MGSGRTNGLPERSSNRRIVGEDDTVFAPYHPYYQTVSVGNQTRLEAACKMLVARHQILRTIFVPFQRQLLQVVLQSFPGDFQHYDWSTDIESYAGKIIECDSADKAALGKTFVRFMFFNGGVNGFRLTLRLNHAQFDGMSFPLVIEDLAARGASSVV